MNPTDARKAPKVYLVQVPITVLVVARTEDSAKSSAWKSIVAGDAWRYNSRERAPHHTIARHITEPTELSYNTYPRYIEPVTDKSCAYIKTLKHAFSEYKARRRTHIIVSARERREARALRRARSLIKRAEKKERECAHTDRK